MKRYRIHYRDEGDATGPVFTTVVRAVDREHAEERFYDSDDTGWSIVKITQLRKAS